LNGAGLDESFITDRLVGETLTTTDGYTYAFSKNMIKADDNNKIYVDDVEKTAGVDFDWDNPDVFPNIDSRTGTVTFGVQQTGVVTGDATYYTIQKSGVTLPRIRFSAKIQQDSHACCQEVMRRVSPNYQMWERRDGKIAVDYVTQTTSGSEDISFDDDDYSIETLDIDAAYEDMATSVISFGQAELEDLPNLAQGKTVTDHWTAQMAGLGLSGWHGSVDVQVVTDGDPETQATSGYGRWSEGTYAVQEYLIALGDDGAELLSVDLEELKEVETIIIARGSQAATEGDGGAVQTLSVWTSNDGGANYSKLVSQFNIAPGANIQFEAGNAFDEGLFITNIQVRIHSLGLYKNSRGATDSQMGISEIQAYPPRIIEGRATLQADDPDADYYDENGLLERYGIRTYLARNGQPDPALNTQEKADADAGFVLDEIVRLLRRVTINAPWLPGIPKYSTIRITNTLTGADYGFFVESRNADEGGHSFTGATLP